MKETLEKLLPNWDIYDCGINRRMNGSEYHAYELETYSPAGEDVIITLSGDSLEELADEARSMWEDFDAEEHAAEILVAKRTGDEDARRFYAAAPDSLSDLLEDAEAIDEMYYELFDTLRAAADKEVAA